MRKLLLLLITSITFLAASAQPRMSDAERNQKKDSTLRAAMHADSLKIEKKFADMEKWDHILGRAEYPLVKEAKMGGIIPVKGVTEIPDPTIEYKLLFELSEANPDSTRSETDLSLSEVARVINLHIASGVPQNKITPVVILHGAALSSVANNEYSQKHYKRDNPNIKLIDELKSIGTKFIICGQAMTFHEMKIEDFLPDTKLSLTAQTVLTHYQLKGFVLNSIHNDK